MLFLGGVCAGASRVSQTVRERRPAYRESLRHGLHFVKKKLFAIRSRLPQMYSRQIKSKYNLMTYRTPGETVQVNDNTGRTQRGRHPQILL